MKLSITQLIRIENALKTDLDRRLISEHVNAFEREIVLNRGILALINRELRERTELNYG